MVESRVFRITMFKRCMKKESDEMVAVVEPETVKKLPTGEFGELLALKVKVNHVWRSGSTG